MSMSALPFALSLMLALALPPQPAIDPFYENRPGKDFRVRAGKPFRTTFPDERHLTEIRRLTFGGENAEAYFSPDGRRLIFQATKRKGTCDQQYVMDLASGRTRLVSTGKGRTTCGYYEWPEGRRIVYASTHGGGDACPPSPDYSAGYVWALYPTYDIWQAAPDGANPRKLTSTPGYDAEATWCHKGGRMVFTSMRDGDLDLYVMESDGTVRRVTHETGYDGGAFFSPDCAEIVWRASRPAGDQLREYRELLSRNLIRPHSMELFIMKADGTAVRQLTRNGGANFCPYFTADGTRIIYTSNAGPDAGQDATLGPRSGGGSGGRHEFDLYLIARSGGPSERITTAPGFDGFPVFSPDGRYLVWGSNRADPKARETDLYIARWVE